MKIRKIMAALAAAALLAAACLGSCGNAGSAAPAEKPGATTAGAAETSAETADAVTAAAETSTAEPAAAEAETPAPAGTSKVAGAGDMTTVEEVVEAGMVPVPASDLLPGSYEVQVDSSSSMFKIAGCELTVPEGAAAGSESGTAETENAAAGGMQALLTMSGSAYLYVYPGTAEEAAAADQSGYIKSVDNAEGKNTFLFPVEALDQGIPCAAFSKKKEMWYDRTLVFRADSLPLSAFREGVVKTPADLALEDGTYTAEVTLSGGSGKASVQSPAKLVFQNGAAEAELVWSSANYDYMIVDGEKYIAEIADGHSVFRIPVQCFDRNMAVIADTTAMSQAHEISYSLRFDSATVRAAAGEDVPDGAEETYAEQLRMEKLSGGCTLVTIGGTDHFLVVPEGTPEGTEAEAEAEASARSDVKAEAGASAGAEGLTVLRLPLKNIYVADSSVMDLFRAIGALEHVRFTATKASDWRIPEIAEAVEEERILYAGKYSAPDYELLLTEGTDLAIENTMIFHSPETKEKLESLGIPVLVDRASYEAHPLGRLEWIRLIGLLTGKEAEAEALFREQVQRTEQVRAEGDTGKTASFFYISANGYINVRRPEDYIPKMMELAGGHYVLEDLSVEETARSTMNMQPEAFYAAAKEADVLIYNATVAGGLKSLDELLQKAAWLKDFKAVKEGNVWCTEQNMFQQTSGIAGMISELHQVFLLAAPEGKAAGQKVGGNIDSEKNGGEAGLQYLYRLK